MKISIDPESTRASFKLFELVPSDVDLMLVQNVSKFSWEAGKGCDVTTGLGAPGMVGLTCHVQCIVARFNFSVKNMENMLSCNAICDTMHIDYNRKIYCGANDASIGF